ncbi:MAG TPA: efflux RND transporter periplasmic adaptor subunit [Bradyrhizobium sp.]|nr:efflux RND transporter periplasmic adaptor subunit [Bradyrhizobium sp.]
MQKVRRFPRSAGLAALAALLIAAGVLVAHVRARTSMPPPPSAPKPVPVQTVTAETRSVDLMRSGLGLATAWNIATITPQVSGKLIDVPLREGEAARAGDVLARIDPKPFQAALDQAAAKKAQDEAQLANAKLDLKRYTDLVSSNAVPRQQLDTQRALVNQLDAQVQGDQAAIDTARIQLDYATIKAPFAGIVGIRSTDIGNVVSPTSTIVTLTQIEPIAVIFSLPQSDLDVLQAAMRNGKPTVLAYDQQGKALLGRGMLDVINNTIDQTTGTIKLKARFDNQSHALWPGQFLQVRVVTKTEPAAIAIRSDAVQRGPNGPYVWLVGNDNTARLQSIGLGQIQGGQTVVTSGLAAGDRVVVAGQFRVTAGAHVAEAPTETAQAQEGGR